MNNLIFRHKMHFNLRLRFKKCALLLPCASGVGSSGFSFLWRKQELGYTKCWCSSFWFFFSYFGYVFNQLNNNLLKFCPLTSEGFLILTFPVPLPFLCPYLQWMSHISSLPLHKFGSRKEKDHGDLSVPPHSHHFLTLWKAFFLVLSPFWARFWGRMGQGVFYLNLRWWIRCCLLLPVLSSGWDVVWKKNDGNFWYWYHLVPLWVGKFYILLPLCLHLCQLFLSAAKSDKSFLYLVLISVCRWSTADVWDRDLLQRLLFFLDTGNIE